MIGITGWLKVTVSESCSAREDVRRLAENSLWTCDRVADLIAQEFAVSYHAGHVWKILRQLNWSVQRPAGRALERDEAGIQRWKSERWPEIKKKRKRKAARSSSSTKAD